MLVHHLIALSVVHHVLAAGTTTKLQINFGAVGYGLAAIGPGVGIGLIFAAFISGVARQPEAQSRLQSIAILGFVLAEALFIITVALAFVLPL